MNPALIRLILILIILAFVFYGVTKTLLWTPFFKDRKRIERICKAALTTGLALVVTLLTVVFLYSLEHAI